MNNRREYVLIAIGYLIVALYVAFVQDPVGTVILLVVLFLYHMARNETIRKSMETERDMSVSKLQYRLEKTEKRQVQLSDRFDSLSQSFGSGLLMVDEDGIIQYANYDMTDYFGRDFHQLDYQRLSDIRPLFDFVNESYLLERSHQRQILWQGRSYDLISTPLFNEGLFKGALILAHDITQIKHAQEYQKQFTADVSHELKTPLAAIKGFSEILMRGDDMPEAEQAEFIALIHKESTRMQGLLKDLSEIAKLDRLDFELDRKPTDIESLIQECVAILAKDWKESGLELHIDVEPASLMLDSNKMSQVFINIIKNAISYTDEGHISIHGHHEPGRYKIDITDTGIGIEEADYDKIFKRFYRVDKARSRETGGSGLGLSISKNVVLKHGGSIHVHSTPHQGSTFTIILPDKE
jgi:two-component system phosphate regulon sensor histidine kinase PhoR